MKKQWYFSRTWFLGFSLLWGAWRGWAHPLDECQHRARISLAREEIRVDYQVVFGGLLAPEEWVEVDADGDRKLSPEERTRWAAGLQKQVTLTLEGRELPLRRVDSRMPNLESFVGGTQPLVWLTLAGPVELQPERNYSLSWTYHPYRSYQARYQTTVVGPPGTVLFDVDEKPRSLTLTFRLPAQKAPAEGGSEATVSSSPAGLRGGKGPFPTQEEKGPFQRWLDRGLPWGWLVLLLIGGGVVFGALHALQPGHGKALVAAYLVGSRGTVRDAVFLGIVVTLTHTASVFLLGLLAWGSQAILRPQQVSGALTLASGIFITAVGVWFYTRALLARGHHHAHAHPHGQEHSHEPGSVSAPEHTPDHEPPSPLSVSPRSLLSLGIGGGLVPCVDAVMAMLYAIVVRKIGWGLLFITAFSLGLAGVLILVGILVVTGRDRVGRWAQESWTFRALPILSAVFITFLGLLLTVQGLVRTGIITINL